MNIKRKSWNRLSIPSELMRQSAIRQLAKVKKLKRAQYPLIHPRDGMLPTVMPYTVAVCKYMKRTQIYIPEPVHSELVRLAEIKGEPMALIVRGFIEEGMKKATEIDYSGKTALEALATLKLKGGPKDLSHNLDHYLYGGPKKDE